MTFEQQIERLAEIVRLLEKGDAPLEESLRLFEEGTGLIRGCSELLNTAEQRVAVLRKSEDGTPAEMEFLPEDGE